MPVLMIFDNYNVIRKKSYETDIINEPTVFTLRRHHDN